MAVLKTKFIRYPNEREAWGELGVATEQSIKDHIYDFHQFMTQDLGLVQTADTGQLDVNNIPNLDLKAKYDVSTTAKWTAWSYGYLMYAFTDPKQADVPLFIRFEFKMTDGSYTGNTSYRSRTYLNIHCRLMGQSDGAGNATDNTLNLGWDLTNFFAASSNNGNWFSNTMSDSYGFFDDVEGRLYLCICPGIYKGTAQPYTAPQAHIYIERSRNESNVVTNEYVMVQNYSRGLWDTTERYRQFSTQFSSYDRVTYSSTQTSYVPLDGVTINTGMRYNIFRTINVNPKTMEMTTNSNVLSYYNNDISSSGIEVNVKLSETETRRYITVSPTTSCTYTYSTNYGHMIRIE